MLLDNPMVLAIFVHQCKMGREEVVMIENMIDPPASPIDPPAKPFLYEVHVNTLLLDLHPVLLDCSE
jgi:hypothetical protein